MSPRTRTPRLQLDFLEPRDLPSITSTLLISWQAPNGQREVAKVATYSNLTSFLTDITVETNPFPGGDSGARGLDVTSDGRWAVFNGTFNPALSVYSPASKTWKHLTLPGWSLVNNGSYGGLVAAGRYVFAPDMFTFGGDPVGIVRFDLREMSSTRFATANAYSDLNVGLNGKQYGLRGVSRSNDLFDPATMRLENTITPEAGNIVRGVAANAFGQVFIVDWSENVYKLSPTGPLLASYHLTGNSQTPG